MTITVTTITETEFNTRLRSLLAQLEGNRSSPYSDSANPSHPTIGIGFDLTNKDVRKEVFAAMGIPTDVADPLNVALTDAITANKGKSTAVLQAALNTTYGQTFSMTAAQINSAFDAIAVSYVRTAKTSGIGFSNELVALTSLAFNGLYGPGTQAALAIADKYEARAEAWYQIRYVHVAGQNEKRRYAEAALFGLYEPGAVMSEEAARGVYRTYTAHSDKMIDHDVAYAGLLSEANLDLQAAGFSSAAANLEASLQSAADFLVTQYGQGQSFSPLNIWVSKSAGSTLSGASMNPNLMIGDAGSDTLTGGSGNDVLVGGSGADKLEGGKGYDTYKADDNDTIKDADGKGSVSLNGQQLTTAERKEGDPFYLDEAGNNYLLAGATLVVNGGLVIQNYSSGDLGITLVDNPLRAPFNNAKNAISPIVLDLDGNGIATTKVTGSKVFFDLDDSGFAERTGWTNGADGLLVRDLNHDGKIDTGAELFGNHTQLKNGTLAANGYAALADLDDNHDGKLDSQDAAWSELQVWRDANGDGVNQAGELMSLADAGVQSLATSSTSNATTDAAGNGHRLQSSYATTGGTTGQSEDIWFATDPSLSRQVNPLEISDDLRALPELLGYGNVAGLRQVMAQQALVGNTHLKDLVAQFGTLTDRNAREALTTQIIYAWTGVENVVPGSRGYVDARLLSAMEAFVGTGYSQREWGSSSGPNASQILTTGFMEFAQTEYSQLMAQTWFATPYQAIRYSLDSVTQTVKADLSGTVAYFTSLLQADHENGKAQLADFVNCLRSTNGIGQFDTAAFVMAFSAFGADVQTAVGLAWRGMAATVANDRLIGDGSNEIINGLAGDDIIDGGAGNDSLSGDAGADILYGRDGNDTLVGGTGNDSLDGGAGNDTYLFNKGDGKDTIYGLDSTANKRDVLKFGTGIAESDIDLVRDGEHLTLKVRGTSDQVTVAGYFTDDGHSLVSLEAIEFASGAVWDFAMVKSKLLPIGTSANDHLWGYGTDDTINGLAGDDTLYGYGGNDTLDGGAGNDTLAGGLGNDTYLFGNGSGQDILIDSEGLNTIQLAAGIIPANVTLTRDPYALYVSLNNGADKLTLLNWFSGGSYQTEQLRFADNTVWSAADLMARTTPAAGTTGNDVLYGSESGDSLAGLAGNDMLYGYDGNDTLDGGLGNDTYLFGNGSGHDTLIDSDGLNTIQLATGIVPANVTLTRDQYALYVSLNNGADKLTLSNWFSGGSYQTEQLRFADNTVWSAADLMARTTPAAGTTSNDVLYGSELGDSLAGLAGNDTLYGYGGNDTLRRR